MIHPLLSGCAGLRCLTARLVPPRPRMLPAGVLVCNTCVRVLQHSRYSDIVTLPTPPSPIYKRTNMYKIGTDTVMGRQTSQKAGNCTHPRPTQNRAHRTTHKTPSCTTSCQLSTRREQSRSPCYGHTHPHTCCCHHPHRCSSDCRWARPYPCTRASPCTLDCACPLLG